MAPSLFSSIPLRGGTKELMPNMKCIVILVSQQKIRSLLPHPPKHDRFYSVLFILLSLSLPPPLQSVSTYPTAPPPLNPLSPTLKTLTLACLSGLLPCIPPSPVWPQSQEVAQLVDKHHGNGEGVWCGGGRVGQWGWGLAPLY